MASVSPDTPDEGTIRESISDSRDKKISQEAGSSPSGSSLTRQLNDQVASLETEAITIESSEVQARVRHLIKLIKTNLQSRTLDKKTQRELARLLSLTPTLDGRHAQQLNLLDLAVSILLEPNGSASSGTIGNRSGSDADSQLANAKNLVFVQETRRQITQQSRPYPDLLKTIFVTGGGTPYIRLISGLGWFFLLFVMTPLTIAGLTFAARDIAGFREAQNKLAALQRVEADLSEETRLQQAQIERLTRRRDALAAQLGRTNSQIAAIATDSPAPQSSTTNSTSNTPDSTSSSRNPSANNPSAAGANDSPTAPSNTSSRTDQTADFVVVSRQALNSIQTEIEAELRSNLNRETTTSDPSPSAGADRDANTAESNSSNGRDAGRRSDSLTESEASVSETIDSWVSTPTFSLILLAVAMGALGSTISVIVRANTFIRQAQENDNDLFLTGFFRPFVGMSFAIFCVALVEAGIFSGIFDLTNRKDTDRTYFYVAIAFVAGFSERLVRDVVIKTEDSIAGPANKDDRWT